jgi:predicted GIY-YIG superfamily endonuclease
LEEHDFWGPFRPDELNLEYPEFCAECRYVALVEAGRVGINPDHPPENRLIAAHIQLVRRARYVYVLKLSNGSFYVGQTTDPTIRLQEHRDGMQRQTKGKDPRLVWYESFEGERDAVKEREEELTRMNLAGAGQRRLRQMIERFRAPLRLLDLEA